MNINELTVGQIKEILALFGGQLAAPAAPTEQPSPFRVGEAYVFRTVTMTVTGRVKAVYPTEILLDEAAWIADTGRYNEFLKDPQKVASEVEPYPGECGVGRGSIADFGVIPNLPTKVR